MTAMSRILILSAVASLASTPAFAANIAAGQQLYSMHCAACHGPRGEGVVPEAPKFRMGERLEQPDMVLMQSVKSGKKTMPPFFGILQDAQILDVLAFVRTLR
ncbi:MAG: cytochrome c, class [Proteobacteria bacterium]|nr:cytochrome c, class [Pseudomonadota bacterium]